jgi:hypothetical protein
LSLDFPFRNTTKMEPLVQGFKVPKRHENMGFFGVLGLLVVVRQCCK